MRDLSVSSPKMPRWRRGGARSTVGSLDRQRQARSIDYCLRPRVVTSCQATPQVTPAPTRRAASFASVDRASPALANEANLRVSQPHAAHRRLYAVAVSAGAGERSCA